MYHSRTRRIDNSNLVHVSSIIAIIPTRDKLLDSIEAMEYLLPSYWENRPVLIYSIVALIPLSIVLALDTVPHLIFFIDFSLDHVNGQCICYVRVAGTRRSFPHVLAAFASSDCRFHQELLVASGAVCFPYQGLLLVLPAFHFSG